MVLSSCCFAYFPSYTSRYLAMICDDLIANWRMLFPEPGFWLGKQHPPGRPPSILSFLLPNCLPLVGSSFIHKYYGGGNAVVSCFISFEYRCLYLRKPEPAPFRAFRLPPCQCYTASPPGSRLADGLT